MKTIFARLSCVAILLSVVFASGCGSSTTAATTTRSYSSSSTSTASVNTKTLRCGEAVDENGTMVLVCKPH